MSSLTFAKPTGVQDNDVAVACMWIYGDFAIWPNKVVPPPGWNSLGSVVCDPKAGSAGLCESYNEDPVVSGAEDALWCFYHTVSGDGSSYQFTMVNDWAKYPCSGGVGQCFPSQTVGGLAVYRGANPITPVENHSANFLSPSQTASAGNQLVAAGFNTVNGQDMLVAPFFDVANANVVGNPSGFNKAWSMKWTGAGASSGGYSLKSSSGSTGNPAAPITSGDYGYAELIALTTASVAPTSTPSLTPTPTATATPATSPTVTATPTALATKTATPTPTATSTVKASTTPTATPSSSASATSTPKATPTATPAGTIDIYGGTTNVQCAGGPQAHFYTEQVGDRWWICDPLGNGYFMKGLTLVSFNVDPIQSTNYPTKYATGFTSVWQMNWSLEMANRLSWWGFNLISEDSYAMTLPTNKDSRWGTSDSRIPVKLPFSYNNATTQYMFKNIASCGQASAIKDLQHGMGSAFTGYPYGYGDYFDPNAGTCATNIVGNGPLKNYMKDALSSYLVYITIDEGDQTGGLISSAGQDFETTPSGHRVGAHPGWVALATAPTQTSNSKWGITSYSDTKVYTKQKLADNLQAKYGTIAALNAAWNSAYTSFGSVGGWGVGTGLLDEDGTCPSRGALPCWMGNQMTLAGETAAMQSDMHDFYVAWLDQYFSIMRTAWTNTTTGAPGVMLSMILGGWGSPPRPEALTEGGKYLDLVQMSEMPPAAWACPTGGCTDTQARIDFVVKNLGNKPWWNWEGIDANPDSAESAYKSISPYTTQAQRGAGYQTMVDTLLNSTKDSTNGVYHVVGFYWWGAYDMDGEKLNWGVITPRDNPYDGKSATVTGNGNDQWGYPTGGEAANYGDFVDDVTTANQGVYANMAP